VQSVQAKTGASGEMVFVTVRHEITVERKSALVEEQDIVYREAPRPEASPASTAKLELPGEHGQSEWTRRIAPDPVQLFRYSALTFNGHRIHYDRDYAREVEGYPGLVVHGPYLATLLVDHFLRRHPGSPVTLLRFRARRPLFDGETLELCGVKNPDGAGLWVRSPTGEIAMDMAITTVRHAVPLSNA
jgi:3-methylfumaryl-CoA hydratase